MDEYKNYKDLDKNMFIDYDMYITSVGFFEYITSPNYFKCVETTKNICRIAKKVFAKYFSLVFLHNLSSEYIIELYKHTNLEEKEFNIINRFLLYLVENDIINDNSIKRLSLFKTRIATKANKEVVIQILTDSRFETYKNKNFFTDSLKIRLYLIKFPKENIVDDILYESLVGRFNEIKLNDDNSVTYKIRECFEFNKIAQYCFSSININKITSQHLYDCIKKHKTELSSAHLLQLSKILLYFQNLNLIYDDKIILFLKLKSYLITGVSVSMYPELLSNTNIQNYVLLPHVVCENVTNCLTFIGIRCKEIFDAWVIYASSSTYRNTGFFTVCKEFDNSLTEFDIKSINELSFKTFCSQIKYFSKYNDKSYISPITAFYVFLSTNYNSNLFESSGIDTKILQRPNIANNLIDGFNIINYNPIEDIPEVDKWILSYTGMEDSNTSIVTTSSRLIDFTKIKSKTYRIWYKYFLWKSSQTLHCKISYLSHFTYFANYIFDLKNGNELSLFAQRTNCEKITVNEVFAYKTHLFNNKENNITRRDNIFAVKLILQNVLDNELGLIEGGAFYHLSTTVNKNENNAYAIPDEDLKKLSALMLKKSESSIIHSIYYAVFYIALETEFRGSHIKALTINCVHETVKDSEYVLISKLKGSAVYGMIKVQS